MKSIDYCKKYGISQDELDAIFCKSEKRSGFGSEKEQVERYPKIFNSDRKTHKKMLALKKKLSVLNKISKKSNPWNKDELKVRPWIYKK